MNEYSQYLEFYKKFSSSQGYYEACDLLAFKNDPWVEYGDFKLRIENNIKKTRAIHRELLVGADICCGSQMWLARFFSKYFSTIYSVDLDKSSFSKKSELSEDAKQKVIPIVSDASVVRFPKSVDFIYCGFNVYSAFIPNLLKRLKTNGRIFLMKPKTGNDITLRSKVTGYKIHKRIAEIKDISKLLKKSCEVNYSEVANHWIFPKSKINIILAGFSVVSMGGIKKRMTKNQFEEAKEFFSRKIHNNALVITQVLSLWEGKKRNCSELGESFCHP